jgi:hypothetical protein
MIRRAGSGPQAERLKEKYQTKVAEAEEQVRPQAARCPASWAHLGVG